MIESKQTETDFDEFGCSWISEKNTGPMADALSWLTHTGEIRSCGLTLLSFILKLLNIVTDNDADKVGKYGLPNAVSVITLCE